jgi:hypothetical protein
MVTTVLRLVGMTEDKAHYSGTAPGGAIVDVLMPKEDLPGPPPPNINVRLEVPRFDGRLPAGGLPRMEPPSQAPLRPGGQVTIVKSRIAGAKYPPEWLDQFLGKKGTILWVTDKGAMVRIGNDATWFAFAELESAD